MAGPGRRILGLAAAGLLCAPALARAQAAGPLRIIVPFPAGGSNDILARILQPHLAAGLGRPVLVENRAGGLGAAGAIEALRAPPDGGSWLLSFDTEATNAAVLDLPYNLLEDFIPAGRVATGPLVFAAHAGQPWRDMAELAAAARAGPIDFATNGTGAIPHLAMLAAEAALGFHLRHAPYRGGFQAAEDVIAGFVPLIGSNLPVLGPALRAGTLRALAVTTAGESPFLPGVRPLAEQGVPGFEAGTWWVLLGPARAPAAAHAAMAEALATALAESEVRAQILAQGAEVAPLGPAATRRFLAAEVARWGEVIRRHGLRG
ncbi:tripartite tricarboxylate transporter substrate-binding protein [Falsiroseomonas tokyonensis]|uniref:Tripartite tricarboxylate transporter substrate-binding protein n=1 Tax=Falsiroseomonas tokyonensis TaxID=430521 RepID=A0ABV7C0X0_9PROT|nr:tripartite tricarboxylate transporter substrate-binding protein [Falsiroseomonas tokyonensis]MBU8541515.1 tripartite tricarboxylate transporter substrate binding protein [Falsiroseomonas tokyonensis]